MALHMTAEICTCDKLVNVCDVDCCCDTQCSVNLFKECSKVYRNQKDNNSNNNGNNNHKTNNNYNNNNNLNNNINNNNNNNNDRQQINGCSRLKEVRTNTSVSYLSEFKFGLFCVHNANYGDFYNLENPVEICQKQTNLAIVTESNNNNNNHNNNNVNNNYYDNNYVNNYGDYYDGDGYDMKMFYDILLNNAINNNNNNNTTTTTLTHSVFGQVQHSSCVTTTTSQRTLATTCQQHTSLDALYHFKYFEVFKVPHINSTGRVALVPEEVICLDASDKRVVCPFNHTNIPSPKFFIGAGLTMCSCAVVSILPDDSKDTKSLEPKNLSYAYNDGIYAGYATMQNSSTGKIIYQVNASKDSNNGFNIMTSLSRSSGLCGGADNDHGSGAAAAADGDDDGDGDGRVPIRFGVNLLGGCFVPFTPENISKTCVDVSNKLLYDWLAGPSLPEYVASSANEVRDNLTSLNGWVKVKDNRASLPKVVSNGMNGCKNMIVGLHVQVTYKRFGYIDDWAHKITNVYYEYLTGPEFVYNCPTNSKNSTTTTITTTTTTTGSKCQNETRKFQISTMTVSKDFEGEHNDNGGEKVHDDDEDEDDEGDDEEEDDDEDDEEEADEDDEEEADEDDEEEEVDEDDEEEEDDDEEEEDDDDEEEEDDDDEEEEEEVDEDGKHTAADEDDDEEDGKDDDEEDEDDDDEDDEEDEDDDDEDDAGPQYPIMWDEFKKTSKSLAFSPE
ncbi:hypothetical protein HELRODRAFT_167073 [Helobdella robusta]|uniref:Tectonic domain-containing protein n=1 Tax=Helobdella robusta TaxID=6412 RepID=T1EYZ2_HELRO|nr:hypothetical protein HELRODRAFT_167073 [Helobdella robusta]ESO10571.1 hypothetical protein HELRODRAFT_167073 [Helobdella robusta]